MGNYKTIEFEINAFCFYYDDMPDWFMDQVSNNNVVLFNCNYDKYGTDKAFCIINANKPNIRKLVSPGEYILQSDYGELISLHPDKFLTKYETK